MLDSNGCAGISLDVYHVVSWNNAIYLEPQSGLVCAVEHPQKSTISKYLAAELLILVQVLSQ